MKKILALTLVLALALGTMSLSAFAAGTDTGSNAAIEFEAGELVVVDPTDPSIPPAYNNLGAFDIVYKTTKITGDDQLAIIGAAGYEKVGMVVKNASGSSAGWTVTLKMDGEFKAGAKTLTGAQIHLVPVTPDSTVGPATSLPADKPVQSTVGIKAVDAGKTIYKSSTGAGNTGSQGLWGSSWTPTLDILAGTAEVANYATTLTWTVTVG